MMNLKSILKILQRLVKASSSNVLFIFIALIVVSHAYTYAPTLWQAYRELSPFLFSDTDALSSYCSAIIEENSIFSTNNSSRFSTLIPSYFRRFMKE